MFKRPRLKFLVLPKLDYDGDLTYVIANIGNDSAYDIIIRSELNSEDKIVTVLCRNEYVVLPVDSQKIGVITGHKDRYLIKCKYKNYKGRTFRNDLSIISGDEF